MNLAEKEANLIIALKNMGKVIIAFSGGVDSTYLTAMAYKTLGDNALAVTLYPEYVPNREIEEAKALAQLIGIKHKVIKINSLSNENIKNNPPERCFFCKTDLFVQLKHLGESLKFDYILDGSNIDDMKDYRPGLKALKSLGIISPLKDAGLTKEEIRKLSKKIKLPTWNRPSFSCLATRIPYGESITVNKLSQIEAAEDLLISIGIPQLRVRHHDTTARIEVLPKSFEKVIKYHYLIVKEFKKLGYDYITLDLQGYRSGSLNDTLKRVE